jgi:hypothetical protein
VTANVAGGRPVGYGQLPYDAAMPPLFGAEQTLAWRADWPSGPPGEVLDRMDRLHWRTVERFGMGGARVRRDGRDATVALLGRLPLLVFEHEADVIEPERIERRWRIAGGLMVRQPSAGTLALGLARRGEGLRARVRVEAMPSRLALVPGANRLHPAFHELASNAYLAALRRLLAGSAPTPASPAHR